MNDIDIVDIDSILSKFEKSDTTTYFQTFMQNSSFEVGLLKLEPGQKDIQGQHSTDELYYVIEGDGIIKIKDQDHPIKKGSCIFIRSNTEHFFYGNNNKLVVLYVFNTTK